jgi:hypothetical protein
MLHFKGNYVSVEWDEKNRWIKYSVYGFAQGAILREEIGHFIDLVEKKKVKKVLVDATQGKVVSREDQEWATTYLLNRLLEAGMRYQAIIMPASTIAQMSFKNMVNKIKDLEIRYFGDEDEAAVWLKSVN